MMIAESEPAAYWRVPLAERAEQASPHWQEGSRRAEPVRGGIATLPRQSFGVMSRSLRLPRTKGLSAGRLGWP